jgi:hypothetical protein
MYPGSLNEARSPGLFTVLAHLRAYRRVLVPNSRREVVRGVKLINVNAGEFGNSHSTATSNSPNSMAPGRSVASRAHKGPAEGADDRMQQNTQIFRLGIHP